MQPNTGRSGGADGWWLPDRSEAAPVAPPQLQLKEAQGARERFFGNISHEIRTPLSLIMLAAGDIQSRAGSALDPRASQSLTSVTEGARKLVRLVDELLLLALARRTN